MRPGQAARAAWTRGPTPRPSCGRSGGPAPVCPCLWSPPVPAAAQHSCGGVHVFADGLGDGDQVGKRNVGFAGFGAVLVHEARKAAFEIYVETTGGVAAEDYAPHGVGRHYLEEILRQEHDAPGAAHVPAALEPYPLVL